MKHSRGFILPALGPMLYAAIAAGAVILTLGIALKVQTSRLAAVKVEYAAFMQTTKTLGEQAAKAAALQAAADQRNKERTDAENTRLRNSNRALADGLRDARSGRNYLPSAAPGAKRPDLACFDRTELERALSEFVERAAGLVGEGDSARIDLDSAKAWARP